MTDDGRQYTFNPAAAVIARSLQLAAPIAGQSVRSVRAVGIQTVTHSTNHTCRANLLQLSWAGRRVGPALYGH
jgi:hypothetical protein